MTKNIAIGSAIVVGLAAVAGLGWKTLKARKASKVTAAPSPSVTTVNTSPKEAVATGEQEKVKSTLSIVKPVVAEPVAAEEVKAVVQDDAVSSVTGTDGETIAAVSRIRVPEASEEPAVDTTPAFWSFFYRNIRREEVVNLTAQDFTSSTKPTLAKGYHKAHIEGFDAPAIVHVTKGHVSAVVHVGGTVFMGFSTSGSRFPKAVSSEADIAGTFHLDARAAKDFLNGR